MVIITTHQAEKKTLTSRRMFVFVISELFVSKTMCRQVTHNFKHNVMKYFSKSINLVLRCLGVSYNSYYL